MAGKLRATIVALFCLFTLSIAAAQPSNDEASTQVSLPNSDAINTEPDSGSTAVTTVPLTKLNFRPVNRRFDVRSKRPCRNHFRVHPEMRRENEQIPYGNDMILASGENSDFENPMLHGEDGRVQGRWIRLLHHFHRRHHHDEDSDSDDDEDDHHFHRRHHHDEDSDSDDDEDDRVEKKFRVLKKLGKHYGHQNWEVEKKKKGGFMKRVRKFLGHFF